MSSSMQGATWVYRTTGFKKKKLWEYGVFPCCVIAQEVT